MKRENTKDLVSIVIRAKNESKWIKHTIDAIKNQTYKNYEIILIDNFSSDQTVNIAKNLGVKKIFKIRNYKPGKALNLGFEKSKAQI